MHPAEIVKQWVACFNRADVDGLAALYRDDAINHQTPDYPIHGKAAIRAKFAEEFARAPMQCVVENLFEDGAWAILEWRDTLGLRGCGFFEVIEDLIVFQRGYWDKLTFLRAYGLPPRDPSA